MSSRVRQALLVVVLASGLLAVAGCDTESVTGGSQGFTVTVTPSPPAFDERYEQASVIIRKLQVLPADPEVAALYGTDELILFFRPTDVNLVSSQDEFISNISLAAGTYNVTEFVITPLVLIDEDWVAPPPSGVCSTADFAVIDGTQPSTIPTTFTFINPPSLTFTIRPGQSRLALMTDIPGLIDGYEASYTCTLGCGPGGTPCLTGFDQAAYRAAVLANMHLE